MEETFWGSAKPPNFCILQEKPLHFTRKTFAFYKKNLCTLGTLVFFAIETLAKFDNKRQKFLPQTFSFFKVTMHIKQLTNSKWRTFSLESC